MKKLVPPKQHPRLMFCKKDIPRIKESFSKEQNIKAYEIFLKMLEYETDGLLKKLSDEKKSNFSGDVITAIESMAFDYAINGNINNGKKSIKSIQNFMSTVSFPHGSDAITRGNGYVIFICSEVYDWCYDLLTPEDKNIMISEIQRLGQLTEIGYPPIKMGAVTGHGGEAQFFRDFLGAGIALYDEQPELYDLVADRFFDQFLPMRNFIYKGGVHHQGDAYGPYRFCWEMFAAWLFKQMGYGRIYSPYQKKVPYQWLYMRRPDGQMIRDGDCFLHYTDKYVKFEMPLFLHSNFYSDPYIKQEYIRQNSGFASFDLGYNGLGIITYLIFNNPDLGGKPLGTLPLSRYYGSPWGMMTARTGWSDGKDSDDVLALMKVGEWWFANHQHLDAGHFQIYCRGILANDSGTYRHYGDEHDLCYLKRSVAHNVMLVDDGEQSKYYGYSINDRGQRIPHDGSEHSVKESFFAKNENKTGKTVANSFGPDEARPLYTYLKGNLTKAYSSKVKNYTRSFVFHNLESKEYPAFLIVYDIIETSSPKFKKSWLLHSIEEPEIQENSVIIKRTENGCHGKLFCNTLLPEKGNIEIIKIGGPGNEYFVDGKNRGPTSEALESEEAGAWRIEVSPLQDSEKDYFLHVLQVSDNERGLLPMPVFNSENKKCILVVVHDRVTVFCKTYKSVKTPVSFNIPDKNKKYKIFVTDLAPGKWEIFCDEKQKDGTVVAKEKKSAWFYGRGGNYTLHYRGET